MDARASGPAGGGGGSEVQNQMFVIPGVHGALMSWTFTFIFPPIPVKKLERLFSPFSGLGN